jgi:hypothetical protein
VLRVVVSTIVPFFWLLPAGVILDPQIKSKDDQDGFYIICLQSSMINCPRFTKHRWMQHATTCQKHANNVKEFIHQQSEAEQETTKANIYGIVLVHASMII